TFGATDRDPGDRFYFEVRNKVWTFTRSNGLRPREKALYAGSSLRRWVRTLAASEDRSVLLTGMRRGLVDGIRRSPRDAVEVLSSAGVELPRNPGGGDR